jgi:hypothetical protein
VLIIASVPIAAAGLLLKSTITGSIRSNLPLIAGSLIVVGVLLAVAERTARSRREVEDVTWRHAVALGAAQACALVPGVSRSGATISAALATGLDRPSATRLSFLLAVPAGRAVRGVQPRRRPHRRRPRAGAHGARDGRRLRRRLRLHRRAAPVRHPPPLLGLRGYRVLLGVSVLAGLQLA